MTTIHFEKYEHSVFDVISNLHNATTGSSIPLNEDADAEYFWLKQRVENWEESYSKDCRIVYNELLIKTLAICVLETYKFQRFGGGEN